MNCAGRVRTVAARTVTARAVAAKAVVARAVVAGGLVIGLAGALVVLAGCSSPLYDTRDPQLQRSLLSFSQRELAEATSKPVIKELARSPRVDSLQISKDILEQIERTTGPAAYREWSGSSLSADLLGQQQATVTVGLRRAVMTSVHNNLSVQFARLGPAIDEARALAAESAFDWTLFGSAQVSRTNEPRVVTNGATPTEIDTRARSATVGVRRRLTTGGQLTVQQNVTTNKDLIGPVPGVYTATPNPAKQADLTVQLDQPLLRNFGSDVALAEVRIAKNASRDQVQQLKQTLIRNVVEVEEAYWNLVSAYANLQISQRLLERGQDVQRVLRTRRENNLDVKQSQLSDAVAQVESRRAEVIRAENIVRNASDRLKTLVNDPGAPVGGELLIVPADVPVDEPVKFSLLESLATALNNRPEVQRALLAIDDASIRMAVANNLRLPELNLRTQLRVAGQSNNWGDAVGDMTDADFVNAVVGVSFEQPIGNRLAEATYKARQLERMQAVITYKDVAQRVVADVKEKLRIVETNYKLIEQTRAARIAAAENVRTLQVEEENLAALTPEFLDLKLRRQQSLASAEQQEIQALTEYNAAVARLYGSMGTAIERNRIEFRAASLDEALRTRLPEGEPVDGVNAASNLGGAVEAGGEQNGNGAAGAQSAGEKAQQGGPRK